MAFILPVASNKGHVSMPLSIQKCLIALALVATVFVDEQPLILRVIAIPLACIVVAASVIARCTFTDGDNARRLRSTER
ncbi:hypothetical protein NOCA250035 [metagenome]|uniref:Uncharacterized protein n=1 Tax=metagenome TaxID=256318 RepID=A0A2P2C8S6_9ZZZZ